MRAVVRSVKDDLSPFRIDDGRVDLLDLLVSKGLVVDEDVALYQVLGVSEY